MGTPLSYEVCESLGSFSEGRHYPGHICESVTYLGYSEEDREFVITCARCGESRIVSQNFLLKNSTYGIKQIVKQSIENGTSPK